MCLRSTVKASIRQTNLLPDGAGGGPTGWSATRLLCTRPDINDLSRLYQICIPPPARSPASRTPLIYIPRIFWREPTQEGFAQAHGDALTWLTQGERLADVVSWDEYDPPLGTVSHPLPTSSSPKPCSCHDSEPKTPLSYRRLHVKGRWCEVGGNGGIATLHVNEEHNY